MAVPKADVSHTIVPMKAGIIDDALPSSGRRVSAASLETNTSTVEYGHEPFETYQKRVKELCLSLWPDPPKRPRFERLLKTRVGKLLPFNGRGCPKDFLIDRLRGGGFNRIISIKVIDGNNANPLQLILRVPRFDDAKPEREVGLLRYIDQKTPIPVAKIHSCDFTSNNALESPYVIQHRISGQDLQRPSSGLDFPRLKFEQKCTVAREIGKVLRILQETKHSSPGRIEATEDANGAQTFTVKPFEVQLVALMDDSELDEASHAPSAPTYDSTLEFFESQFARWKGVAMGISDLKVTYMERLGAATSQMHTAGYFGNHTYSLCHLDLNPRNIMTRMEADQSLTLTGILDWDDSVFAPSFLGCAPSTWLWAWKRWADDPEDKNIAKDPPATIEEQQLKDIWEEAVGPDFLPYAYEKGYRLARQLFQWAIHGIHSTWEMKAADKFLEEWAAIRPQEMPAIPRVLAVDVDSWSTESEGAKDADECSDGESLSVVSAQEQLEQANQTDTVENADSGQKSG